MRVLFLQDVQGSARAGEVKEVADGYARNFLLPKKVAVPATESALRNVQFQRQIEAARQSRIQRENQALVEALNQVELVFKVKLGEQMRMHGSITNADIAEALLRQAGCEVDKHKVELEEPIRTIGSHEVSIHIAKDAVAKIRVNVEEE
jgi:large subunit ribosomal protein L9